MLNDIWFASARLSGNLHLASNTPDSVPVVVVIRINLVRGSREFHLFAASSHAFMPSHVLPCPSMSFHVLRMFDLPVVAT
jgi:hypothetical protein